MKLIWVSFSNQGQVILQCINDKLDHILFKAVYGCTKGHRSIVTYTIWVVADCITWKLRRTIMCWIVCLFVPSTRKSPQSCYDASILVLLWLLSFHTFHSEPNRDVTCRIPLRSYVKVSSLEITASIKWQKEGKGIVWLIFHALRTYLICQHHYSIQVKRFKTESFTFTLQASVFIPLFFPKSLLEPTSMCTSKIKKM